ncbi:hypothetical protein [Pedobacter gandavensis]|uniref:AsmA-like C-terminal domain-containing protein n=1 Tax=Pedobacter gandavensis TaxID=2679963 RepID=A0ABR6EZF5_9SPHI|nr:hypothetical protein [Pedobacter gandavensis]MBB2150361.1 hypothetical protein [Pedobacter gandavensis]
MENILLSGNVKWSTAAEVLHRNTIDQVGVHFSGVGPFHCHSGQITLTEKAIYLSGDVDLSFDLGDLEQLYIGFDDVFPRTLVKNFGMTAQPLRFQVGAGIGALYLFIDYNMMAFTNNTLWFNSIKSMLEQVD